MPYKVSIKVNIKQDPHRYSATDAREYTIDSYSIERAVSIACRSYRKDVRKARGQQRAVIPELLIHAQFVKRAKIQGGTDAD